MRNEGNLFRLDYNSWMEASTSGQLSWKEGRRLRALALELAGWTQQAIARAFAVGKGTVSRWMTAARRGGADALRARPAPGRAPRLTDAQRRRLPDLLWEGPEDHGIWFDAEALTRILEWIHEGGADVTARAEELNRQEKARAADTVEHPRPPHHFLDALLETLLGPR